jgi:nuclear receptor interaction protein
MKNTVYDRLLRREVASDRKRYSGVSGIYGDRKWVQDLDIVNELEGHTGCVNALSFVHSFVIAFEPNN